MRIEKDKVEILCGLHKGETIGSPLGILIENRDFSLERQPEIFNPRPGHADLAGLFEIRTCGCPSGFLKGLPRETAAGVAVGAAGKILLAEFDITLNSGF